MIIGNKQSLCHDSGLAKPLLIALKLTFFIFLNIVLIQNHQYIQIFGY